MGTYLGDGLGDTRKEIDYTKGYNARLSFLETLYRDHLVAPVEADSDDAWVVYHRECALKAYLMFLVGTPIFVEKSETYVDVIYMR